MNHFVTGETIKTLREKKNLTQKQLADQMMISDKTVSKWETNKGLPDITLLEPLAKSLSVSVAELLSGQCMQNRNRSASMLRGHFYVCPVCGNVIYATGEGAFSCCGVTLPPLETEDSDDAHAIQVENVENEKFVTIDHPMTKEHYLSFIAWVTGDEVRIQKLYPEQNAEARFMLRGHGMLYTYCNHHGLFGKRV
ncbi:MAG: helix-turn-helix domain-containing protein [Eubacteriales bacterium]|nr:helix-turn-helix domain-containing protein [Eubacteriales bacterium]